MSEITKDNILQEAKSFFQTLAPQKTATVVGLYGDLGAGKTTFTQALAKVLGITETVTSPTFVLEKMYTLNDKKLNKEFYVNFSHLIHIDTYRLRGSSELKRLGWDTMVSNPKNLIIVEWADKIEDILPKHTKKIFFKIIGKTSQKNIRDISYA